jgi:hypothetical protein
VKEPTDAQLKQWDEKGYLVFENAIEGDVLKRLQEAFDYWTAEGKPDWLARVTAGQTAPSFYDFPECLKKDDVFLEIADRPSYYGCLRAFCDGEPILQDVGPRIVPLSPISYTSWHPDTPHSRPLHIKIQIYVSDMAHGGGEFAYVPGSHKPDAGPFPPLRRQEDMPGMVRFTGKAGTAVMFNCYGWHTALDNDGAIPRKSIIMTYHQRTENDRVEKSPFKFLEDRCTTDERRRFLCLQA